MAPRFLNLESTYSMRLRRTRPTRCAPKSAASPHSRTESAVMTSGSWNGRLALPSMMRCRLGGFTRTGALPMRRFDGPEVDLSRLLIGMMLNTRSAVDDIRDHPAALTRQDGNAR